MAVKSTFEIVGAGLAGATAAETLRSQGFDGRIVLIGDETARPYDRPPLSKDYLRGEKGFEAAAVHEKGYYDANGIELRTSTIAESIDPKTDAVVLSTGERLSYDRLLLATGAAPRRLAIPGADLPGVHYLRRLEDADRLRQALRGKPRVVVIGSGWIGLEVAASARQLSAEVVLVGRASLPLGRILGPEVGAVYRDLHAEHGVTQRFRVSPESFRGSSSVEEVRLSDGTIEPADLVVVGVGVAPRTGLAEQGGLAVVNGVTVDEHLRASIPGVYAAGDVASVFHPRYGTHIRLEHWSAALNQGPVAAQNMLGQNSVYGRVPYFYSDQYDFGMEYRGWAPAWDRVVFRGDPAGREFIAFWMRDGRVIAAMNANVWDASKSLAALVTRRGPVDAAHLADPERPLDDLAPQPAS
jgi:3-phenylpropionate/trans-cinnamate dioxygenase ferredoxin reductase component